MIKVQCSICERELKGASLADWPHLPFCSERCRTIDLGRWLSGVYGFPMEECEATPALDADDLDTP